MLWFQDILVIWNQICDDIFPMSSLGEHFAWAMSQGGVSARTEEGPGAREGNEPWAVSLAVYLISRSCLRCSLGTIIHSHYILTPHHHPTYYKSSQKTPTRGKRPVRTRIVPAEDENDIHELRRGISRLFFWKFYSSTSGIIDKHDETLTLNKLFWDKKSLGNITAGTSNSFNSFCLFS